MKLSNLKFYNGIKMAFESKFGLRKPILAIMRNRSDVQPEKLGGNGFQNPYQRRAEISRSNAGHLQGSVRNISSGWTKRK